MSVTTFAAIDVGSYEIAVKIFEISNKGKIKQIDHVRHRIDLGTDTYRTGKISYERMEELCRILNRFREVMDTYKVKEYRAFATSAVRETENTRIVLDQIKLRTSLTVEVLSNSEQRFINYKSVALNSSRFDKLISEGSAILDIGGGSVQISFFDKGRLLSTANMNLGILKIRDQLLEISPKAGKYEQLLEELIDNEVHILKQMYLKELDIKNVIVVDDYISYILRKIGGSDDTNLVTGEQFVAFVDEMKESSPMVIAKELGLPPENSTLLLPSAILIRHILNTTGAGTLWMPGVSLADGMAYDYAQKKKLLKGGHDFDKDILSSAENISKRFRGGKRRGATLSKVSLSLFDAMKKIHGLGERERLLLQLSAILRDCGKYISTSDPAQCSYDIIMHTAIIGLSHQEREIVAQTVKNSFMKFLYYDELVNIGELSEAAYLVVAKLTAILQVSSGLARNRKKPYEKVETKIKNGEIIISLKCRDDLTLEKGLFEERTAFFEEVFGMKPVPSVTSYSFL